MFVSSVYHPAQENAIRKQEEEPAKGEMNCTPFLSNKYFTILV